MNAEEAAEKIIDVATAATVAEVSEKTIRDALKTGALKGVNMGGSRGWILRPKDVVDWIDTLIDDATKKKAEENSAT